MSSKVISWLKRLTNYALENPMSALARCFGCYFLYICIGGFIFAQGVIAETRDVIKFPALKGVTVKNYEQSILMSANTKVLYSFNTREELFEGLLKLCEYYPTLGWEEVVLGGRTGCTEKIQIDSTEKLRTNRLFKFCIKEGARVTLSYPSNSQFENDPWSIGVYVFARMHGPVC